MSGGRSASTRPDWFRGDLDGLRAVAIAAVVAFHVGVPGVSGGFVGVDVFFVISGYLISRRLLDEAAGGTIDVLAFWCRRIRRLVPLLATVVVVTVLASMAVLPPAQWRGVATAGGAAALYLSNVFFARESGDYFGGVVGESPFLHTWSLGVEEQFYLVWPLLIFAVTLVARRGRSRVGAVAVVLSAVSAASFAWSLHLTASGSAFAFYGPFSRVWEFALGGIAATVAISSRRRVLPASIAAGVAAAGLAAVAAASTLADPGAFPGWWASMPVIGAMAVVVAGESANVVSGLLDARPLRWIGRVSYSWYLWHWPAIVLVRAAVPDGGAVVAAAAAAATLPVAAASHRFLENPVRYHPRLRGSKAATLVVGGSLTVVAVLASVAVASLPDEDGRDLASQLNAAAETLRRRECEPAPFGTSRVDACVLGDRAATVTVLAIGDSHVRHWTEALGAAAGELGVRLVVRGRNKCPAFAVTIADTAGGRSACVEHRADTARLIDELRPDAVVLADSEHYGVLVEGDPSRPDAPDGASAWRLHLDALVTELESGGARVGIIEDNPFLPEPPVPCLSTHDNPDECSYPLDELRGRTEAYRSGTDAVIAAHASVVALDTTRAICPADRCRTVIDGELVYLDPSHLSPQFTVAQVPEVRAFLRRLLSSS